MAAPDLVIPLKFDYAEVMKQLDALKKKLDKLSDDNKEGMKEAAKEARGFGAALGDIVSHQGYAVAKDLVMGLAKATEETAQHAKEVATEFIRARDALQQVAALLGKDNTNTFTVEQARKAEAASLTLPEWTKFQEQFQSYGGAFLEGPMKRLDAKDAEVYQQKVAEFAKARGINASDAAQLAGGLLQFSEGPTTTPELLDRFGKVFKTLERSPTPVPQLLPQMTRIMAQGASPEEAAQLLSIMSEALPGEEQTGVENVLKGLREARLKGKGEELGLKKGMTPLEQVRAAAATITGRVQAGEDQEAILSEYFTDDRQFRGMTGFLSRGMGEDGTGEGFARVAGYAAESPRDAVDQAIKNYEKSDAGISAKNAASLARSKIESGRRTEKLEQEKIKAEKELEEEGRFDDMSGFWDAVRGTLPGLPSVKNQLINERAMRNVNRDAGLGWGVKDQALAFGEEQATMDAAILEVLKSIDRKTRDHEQAPTPLAAPSPQVNRGPGG